MSVRLFHRGTRLVARVSARGGDIVWCAFHRQPVGWAGLFVPALLLVGFTSEQDAGGISFGDGGAIRWTRRVLWTTIRLRLPPCSERKAALLAAGLLKAARYGEQRQ